MPLEQNKDVLIEGRTFKIGRVPASVGLWIYTQMAAGKASDAGVYEKVMRHLFEACELIQQVEDKRVPMKIFADGAWVIPEPDIETVYQLYDAALSFNFDTFLKKRTAEAKERARLRKLEQAAITDTMQ